MALFRFLNVLSVFRSELILHLTSDSGKLLIAHLTIVRSAFTEQYTLVRTNGRRCSAAGKVNVDLSGVALAMR